MLSRKSSQGTKEQWFLGCAKFIIKQCLSHRTGKWVPSTADGSDLTWCRTSIQNFASLSFIFETNLRPSFDDKVSDKRRIVSASS
jgi:hypothetical protein